MNKFDVNRLRDFETKIADYFNSGQIRAPVHLYDGNEAQLLEIFYEIQSRDWVFCSWRSHYQCLLKGVPEDVVEREILAGRSISLCFPEYRIFSSAIVGGQIPIATGVALSLKKSGDNAVVYCFMGDMTSETGIAHECIKYCRNHDLPIVFIVEDNGKSVCTDTLSAWGMKSLTHQNSSDKMVRYYRYESKYPHAGAGIRVQF